MGAEVETTLWAPLTLEQGARERRRMHAERTTCTHYKSYPSHPISDPGWTLQS